MVHKLRFFVSIWRYGRNVPMRRAWRLAELLDELCDRAFQPKRLIAQEVSVLRRKQID
jgi:hypothetical protein